MARKLAEQYDVLGFYYNPNIFPEDEYYRRMAEFERLCALWHVPVEAGPYDHGRFLEKARGLEKEPEGGKRCEACYRLRLEAAAARAMENDCLFMASTLTVGPNKRAAVINPIGREVCVEHGVQFVEEDWKKKDGYKHSIEVSHELGLYRQNYCGCEFSRRGTRIGSRILP